MANDKISPKIEALAAQATGWMNFAAQVLNSGAATPVQFTQAKKLFGRFVMYAERPKPDTVSQKVYDQFCAAAKKLGKALVDYQNAVMAGEAGATDETVVVRNGATDVEVVSDGYYSGPEEPEFVEVDEVDVGPVAIVQPVPAGEPPSFFDYAKASLREHPLGWGAAAVVAGVVGYHFAKKRGMV